TQGYRDATAPYTRAESNGELLITFTIRKGPLYRVSHVEISGNASVPLTDFEADLRVRDGQPFAAAKLDADVGAIEAFYHRQGFAGAKALAAVEAQASQAGGAQVPVAVRIVIREGVRTDVAG